MLLTQYINLSVNLSAGALHSEFQRYSTSVFPGTALPSTPGWLLHEPIWQEPADCSFFVQKQNHTGGHKQGQAAHL